MIIENMILVLILYNMNKWALIDLSNDTNVKVCHFLEFLMMVFVHIF